MRTTSPVEAISFDLFGTLVTVESPADPAAVVATELETRGIAVPPDWSDAYHESHVETHPGGELSLPTHVSAALASRGVAVETDSHHPRTIRRAVTAAFDPAVRTCCGAIEAVEAAADRWTVGVLSNCSVPELAQRTLNRSALDRELFDTVVTSVDCGWRKPDQRAFEAVADRLGVALSDVVHVGDDPQTDRGAADIGATTVLIDDVPLSEIPFYLEEKR